VRFRPFYLFAVLCGATLSLLLLWLLQWKGPASRNSGPLLATKPVGRAKPAAPDSVSALAETQLREVIAAQVGSDLLSFLQRRLPTKGARPNEGVLKFSDAEAYHRFLARARESGLEVIGQLDGLLTVRVRYDSLPNLQHDMLQNPTDYAAVGANYLLQIPTAPPKEDRPAVNQVPFGNDTLALLGVTGDHSQWGRGTTIAILDSGVSPDATFGQGRLRTLDIGLGTTAGTGADDGHGTAVASLAAGLAPDAPGVAPSANLLSIRVTDASGTSDIFTVAQGIIAAVDAGAQILNISLGGYATNDALDQAIDYAVAHGAVIVAAAGNDQAAQLTWPAADPRVISVGAVDALEQQVSFSNSGPQLQMTAPGYGVQTAWLNGQRVTMDGTSASAPIVAGGIAAVMSENPGLNAVQAWQMLQQYADDLGAPGPDPDYGNGVINLGWAMNHSNPARIDLAVSSHYYDAENSEMDFVIQNRGSQTMVGAQLAIDVSGATARATVPTLAPGAIAVITTPVDQNRLESDGTLVFRTQLDNPAGYVDQFPANNRKSSVLSAPKK
jgi:hypothetical protein